MGITTDLRREIRRAFVPLMEGKGFLTDLRRMPRSLAFRKTTPDRIYVCDIQWEKHGRPRFVLNFGSCGAFGVVVRLPSRSIEIEPADITAADTPWRGRLMPRLLPNKSDWFRQDRNWLQGFWKGARLRPPDEVVGRLIDLFPEVQRYWENGTIGKHMRVHNLGWSQDKVGF